MNLIIIVKVSACWFCLANPKVEKHLVVSVGDELYLSLAKGPVVEDNSIPGKGHALIIPINHFPTFGKIPPEVQPDVIGELKKYKQALQKFYDQYNQDMVVFEVSRDSVKGLSHALIQVVPIPKAKSDSVEKVARELGEAAGMQFTDQIPVSTIRPTNTSIYSYLLVFRKTQIYHSFDLSFLMVKLWCMFFKELCHSTYSLEGKSFSTKQYTCIHRIM